MSTRARTEPKRCRATPSTPLSRFLPPIPTCGPWTSPVEPPKSTGISAAWSLPPVRVACGLSIAATSRSWRKPDTKSVAAFLAAHGVEVVASLPCYLEDNVDRQRGKGAFNASIRALQRLNALGYGHADSELVLDLVYNPQGPSLPPAQESLERDYKQHLGERYGIVFHHLFTLTNMPIQRFGSMLLSKGEFHSYMQLLRSSHREVNLEHVMCRELISVDGRAICTTATSISNSACRSATPASRACI